MLLLARFVASDALQPALEPLEELPALDGRRRDGVLRLPPDALGYRPAVGQEELAIAPMGLVLHRGSIAHGVGGRQLAHEASRPCT